MKKIFKKNQVIITALAIMIAVAGYLNFTSDKDMLDSVNNTEDSLKGSDDAVVSAAVEDSVDDEEYEKNAEEIDNDLAEKADEESANDVAIDDAEQVDSSEVATNEGDATLPEDVAQASLDENGEPIQSQEVGEAVLTNGAVTISEAKMNREQVRAKAKDMLLEIINNEKLAEDSKKEAINKMMSMTENMEKENAAETQLAAKGFPDSVVTISEDNVDVTLNCSELNGKQRAQIEDIITRKTGYDLNKIIITTAQTENEI